MCLQHTTTNFKKVRFKLYTKARSQQQPPPPEQLREARAEVATLRLQVRQLEAEVARREAALDTARREHGARVARLEAAKQEDIQTSVELRLALHAR